MELRESIESINAKLLYEYGVEIQCGNAPKFRVVFSDDCVEKRWTEYTDEGLLLQQPEVREFKKYSQWIKGKYILERLVPVGPESDLTTKVSYEPAWVFQDKHGNYLPPFFEGCKFVVESIFAAIDRKGTHTKYKDESITPEARKAEIDKMEKELFGNETAVGDALAYKYGVGFTTSKLLQ